MVRMMKGKFMQRKPSTLLMHLSGDTEYMKIEDTYSPVLHRINQAIRRRAVRPDEAVQPPPDILMKFSNPPSELVTTSSSKLKKLIAAADVKQGTFNLLSHCPNANMA